MKRPARLIVWSLGGLVASAIVLFFWANAAQTGAPDPSLEDRNRVPHLVFVDLEGHSGKLSDYVGKIVVVNFWASWCPPCRKEIPALVQISKEYASRGLVVLGVAMDEGGLNGVRRFLQEVDVTYPVVIPDGSSSLSSVRGLPTTWLIDKQGRIAAIYAGAMTEDVFRQGIEQLLGEPRAVPDRPR